MTRGASVSPTKNVARFLDKVQITKSCWLWIGYKNQKGYGQFGLHGKIIGAHRFSYELFVGLIEPGKMILHRRGCGNPSCVNPLHLYMGTASDNVRDMYAWGNPVDPPRPYGEDHHKAKLSEEDVLAIRRAYKNGEYISISAMADEFGVSRRSIRRAAQGITWKHLNDTS